MFLASGRGVLTEDSLQRPLTQYLWSRIDVTRGVRSLGDRVLEQSPDQLAQELADRVIAEQIDPVRILSSIRGEWQDHDDSNYRFTVDRTGASSPHCWIAVLLEGDADMLLHFPDSAVANGVAPLAERPHPIGGYYAEPFWCLPTDLRNTPFGEDERPYVWSELILPRNVYESLGDTSVDARQSTLMSTSFFNRLSRLVDEIARTTESWAIDLRNAIVEHINAERDRLLRRANANEGLQFFEAWRPPAPRLSQDHEVVEDDRQEVSDDPTNESESQAAQALSTERLSASSFDDFLAVPRQWVEPLIRSPRSFAQLPEEDMSGLLAATLNATFPFAAQEVFSYQGKTDIYVRADSLDGSTAERVFILENHWWDGESLLHTKLDQLFGYCTVRDTEAALMAMIHERDQLPDVHEALLTHRLRPTEQLERCGFRTYDVHIGPKHVQLALIVVDLRGR
jgi:hypothetical protein